jgi:cobalt transporter subunit CbtB
MRETSNRLSGLTGKETDMTVLASKRTFALQGVLPIAFALIAGLGLVFAAGLSQAAVLHDSAHDVRHAMAFPCH